MLRERLFIVGSGLFGAVVAERAATAGAAVTVCERRNHIGGNCWSDVDSETGVEVHKYGSHIFHTSDAAVWEYVRRFAEFNEYRHTVLTTYNGEVYTLPINLGSINQYYHACMTPEEAKKFIQSETAKWGQGTSKNLEEKAVSLIGRGLYEAFIRGYTMKQWEKDPRELSPDIITRLPVRYNYNHRYFADRWEGIPVEGYGKMLGKILANPGITVKLNTPWEQFRPAVPKDAIVVYTGAIDEFFDYELGRLEWRTVDFIAERYDYSDYQGTTVMNYADADVPYTRIHEFKHYHPERPDTGKTIIYKEFSRFAKPGDEPYYPVLTEPNKKLFAQYQELAKIKAPNVIFGGRLGSYRYFDMDDTIAAALQCWKDIEL